MLDINECEVNNGGCEHNCSNIIYSYNCSCYPGYTLNSTDEKTCWGMIRLYVIKCLAE